jgi:hypothetical protein
VEHERAGIVTAFGQSHDYKGCRSEALSMTYSSQLAVSRQVGDKTVPVTSKTLAEANVQQPAYAELRGCQSMLICSGIRGVKGDEQSFISHEWVYLVQKTGVPCI